ncbi:MAG: DUF1275 domain-containing protein [Sphingomonas taxi]|uniref:DUF1275 domain-containing protein n=1 Tax=Sphingomonas taxi TaxID=1549858 RepID=A0A2W5PFQ0_9SPHN|nr:MAG: DUF1275 domain-containing protein [Sphingomonas taxi]
MTRNDWGLATAMAGLAGYVDAIGFVRLGGLFVAFMSGNSTQLAVDAADGGGWRTMTAALILGFVAGVMVATIMVERLGRRSPVVMILLSAALLAWAALLMVEGPGAMLLAMAMGVLNVVFQRGGSASVPVTYMTGTLVRLGQSLAHALMGTAAPTAWLPYLLLWGGLVAGASGGTLAYAARGTDALWPAVIAAAVLAAVASRMRTVHPG